MEKQDKEKILSISILRFVAAIAVMMYHYIFMFTQRGYTDFDYQAFWGLSQYGYLGVDLFFIISGFVIAMSAENRTLFQFAVSRVSRLYPIYWASVIITSLFLYFYGSSINTFVDIKTFLANMTMQPSLFGFAMIDGSYWSLTVELIFYILIGVLLFTNKYKHLEKITLALSLVISIGAITNTVPFNWASYFLAGIIFHYIYKNGFTWLRFVSILSSMTASIIYAVSRAPGLSAGYYSQFNTNTITFYIISFYIIFFLISIKIIDDFINSKFSERMKSFIIILGSLTFPLYLLHQTIGHIVLKYLESENINAFLSLGVTSIFIISISYTLNVFVEKQGKNIITRYANYLASLFKTLSLPKTFSK